MLWLGSIATAIPRRSTVPLLLRGALHGGPGLLLFATMPDDPDVALTILRFLEGTAFFSLGLASGVVLKVMLRARRMHVPASAGRLGRGAVLAVDVAVAHAAAILAAAVGRPWTSAVAVTFVVVASAIVRRSLHPGDGR